MKRRIVAAAAAGTLLLGAAACSDDDSSTETSGQPTTTAAPRSAEGASMATGVDSPASTLRSQLTALLQEHVYLAGIAINQAVADGGNMQAPATASAVATLDDNSVALSEAIGSVYGPEAAEQFLALWREHIGFFVDYTLGGATNDAAKQAAAKQALDDYRTEFGAFVDSATNGELPSEDVAASLQVHVNTLVEAIDAILAGSTEVYPKLQAAASHMPMTAQALAQGIVASGAAN